MTDDNMRPLQVLFLGASFGVVLGMRIAAAGHKVTFVCRDQEAALINSGKLFLRLAAKQKTSPLDIGPQHCRIAPDAAPPEGINAGDYDLVCLAMQEPQFSSSGVRDLVVRIAAAGTPVLSIMNMPLPPYLKRFMALDDRLLNDAFTDASLWSDIDSANFTMASADPQAMRVDTDDALIIAVTLPTNFKVAPFEQAQHQAMLERLASDIDATRVEVDGASWQPCVRLRPDASLFIPLAKWPMLITGNFRCLTSGEPLSIRDAVCRDEAESRELYEWMTQFCIALGVEEATLVPFTAYKAAAEGLSLPSSLARGLYAGATAVERVDLLIQKLAGRLGMSHPALDRIVVDVSSVLERNNARRAEAG